MLSVWVWFSMIVMSWSTWSEILRVKPNFFCSSSSMFSFLNCAFALSMSKSSSNLTGPLPPPPGLGPRAPVPEPPPLLPRDRRPPPADHVTIRRASLSANSLPQFLFLLSSTTDKRRIHLLDRSAGALNIARHPPDTRVTLVLIHSYVGGKFSSSTALQVFHVNKFSYWPTGAFDHSE